jgi:hypothetical protein
VAFKRINRAADICREMSISLATFYRLRALPEGDPRRFPDPDVRQDENKQIPGWTDETCEGVVRAQIELERASRAATKLQKRRASPAVATA